MRVDVCVTYRRTQLHTEDLGSPILTPHLAPTTVNDQAQDGHMCYRPRVVKETPTSIPTLSVFDYCDSSGPCQGFRMLVKPAIVNCHFSQNPTLAGAGLMKSSPKPSRPPSLGILLWSTSSRRGPPCICTAYAHWCSMRSLDSDHRFLRQISLFASGRRTLSRLQAGILDTGEDANPMDWTKRTITRGAPYPQEIGVLGPVGLKSIMSSAKAMICLHRQSHI